MGIAKGLIWIAVFWFGLSWLFAAIVAVAVKRDADVRQREQEKDAEARRRRAVRLDRQTRRVTGKR